MSKLFCTCGRLIRMSGEVPNPREWKLIPDDELHGRSPRLSVERIVMEAPALVRCPECDRLWVYWRGLDHPPTEYAPAAGT